MESRTKQGRGAKRGNRGASGTPVETTEQDRRKNLRSSKGKSSSSSGSKSGTNVNSPAKRKGQRGGSDGDEGGKSGSEIDSKRKRTDSSRNSPDEDDSSEEKDTKGGNDSDKDSATSSIKGSKDEDKDDFFLPKDKEEEKYIPPPPLPYALCCPKSDCKKRYRQRNGLRFHVSSAHPELLDEVGNIRDTSEIEKMEKEAKERLGVDCSDEAGDEKATDIKAEMTKKEEDVIKESPVDLSDCHTAWYDLEPEDSDDEPDMVKGPPEIQSRPVSPENTLVRPIPIKPNPKQTITLSDVTSLESKQEEAADKKPGLLSLPGSLGMIPEKIKEKPEGTQQVTLTLGGSGSSKSVLKALKGLAKLLEIDTPKQWMQEDVKTENTKAMFRVRREGGRDGPPLDLQAVLNRNSKVCRHCDIIIQHDAVKKKAVDLPFMSKQEVEESSDDIVLCDEACYFQFAIKKSIGAVEAKVGAVDATVLAEIDQRILGSPAHEQEPEVGAVHGVVWLFSLVWLFARGCEM